eukprot:Opistho-1_new@59547
MTSQSTLSGPPLLLPGCCAGRTRATGHSRPIQRSRSGGVAPVSLRPPAHVESSARIGALLLDCALHTRLAVAHAQGRRLWPLEQRAPLRLWCWRIRNVASCGEESRVSAVGGMSRWAGTHIAVARRAHSRCGTGACARWFREHWLHWGHWVAIGIGCAGGYRGALRLFRAKELREGRLRRAAGALCRPRRFGVVLRRPLWRGARKERRETPLRGALKLGHEARAQRRRGAARGGRHVENGGNRAMVGPRRALPHLARRHARGECGRGEHIVDARAVVVGARPRVLPPARVRAADARVEGAEEVNHHACGAVGRLQERVEPPAARVVVESRRACLSEPFLWVAVVDFVVREIDVTGHNYLPSQPHERLAAPLQRHVKASLVLDAVFVVPAARAVHVQQHKGAVVGGDATPLAIQGRVLGARIAQRSARATQQALLSGRGDGGCLAAECRNARVSAASVEREERVVPGHLRHVLRQLVASSSSPARPCTLR